MNKTRIHTRILVLLNRLETDQAVSRRSIARVTGPVGMERFDQEWRSEKRSRGYKPKELLQYAAMLKQANIQHTKAETASVKKQPGAKRMFEKAESLYESALENLRNSVAADWSLRLWLDRDPEIDRKHHETTIAFDPEGMPRPIWQIPGLAKKQGVTQLSLKDLKIAALHQALEELTQTKRLEIPEIIRSRHNARRLDTTGFRFD